MGRNRRAHSQFAHSNLEVDTEGSWAISYGDMVTLLLTFFIMFFAADKFVREQSQIKLDLRPMASVLEQSMDSFSDKSNNPSNEVMEKVKGKVYKMGNRLLLEFPAVSFFKSGGLDVTPMGMKTLNNFYKTYQPYMGQYQLGVRAFTDTKKVLQRKNLPFRDNLELSALRSVAVMRKLRDMGIPLTSMKLSGYGEMLLTMKDLETIPTAIRKPASIDNYARTVVLVIEPKEEP